FAAKLRQEARQKHNQWVIAQRFWSELVEKKKEPMPCRLADFSDKVKNYVNDYLMPKLTDAEKKQLVDADGRWPDYPQTLFEIASKRPPALWPCRLDNLSHDLEHRPRQLEELPRPIQVRITETKKGIKNKAFEKLNASYKGTLTFA